MSKEEVQDYVRQLPEIIDEFIRHNTKSVAITIHIVGLVIGFVLGLFLFGWYLTPVEYAPATYSDLTQTRQVELVYLTADLFAYSRNTEQANGLLQTWNGGQLACELIPYEQNIDKRERLLALTKVTGVNCNGE